MKKILNLSKIIALGFLFAAGISYAWISPVGTAPTNNVSAPINVSSSTQNKLGALGLNILSIFQQGQISTTTYAVPSSLLFGVNGKVGAKEYCDETGANCSTPPFGSGGGGGNQKLVKLSGSGSWTVPVGVTSIKTILVGGGGGGASDCGHNVAGGGGGGGAAMIAYLNVIAGQTLSYSVGAGGAGAAPNVEGTAGGATTFDGLQVGGGGGGYPQSYLIGAGGAIISQTPTKSTLADIFLFPGNGGSRGFANSSSGGAAGLLSNSSQLGNTGALYGGGGSGDGGCSSPGWAGANGVIFIEYGTGGTSGSSSGGGPLVKVKNFNGDDDLTVDVTQYPTATSFSLSAYCNNSGGTQGYAHLQLLDAQGNIMNNQGAFTSGSSLCFATSHGDPQVVYMPFPQGLAKIKLVHGAYTLNYNLDLWTNGSSGGGSASSGVPSGAVMAFNLASCPSGWSPATAAVGRTIVGAGQGSGLTNRTLGSAFGSETSGVSLGVSVTPWGLAISDGGPTPVTGVDASPFNVVQPSVAYLYCQKD